MTKYYQQFPRPLASRRIIENMSIASADLKPQKRGNPVVGVVIAAVVLMGLIAGIVL